MISSALELYMDMQNSLVKVFVFNERISCSFPLPFDIRMISPPYEQVNCTPGTSKKQTYIFGFGTRQATRVRGAAFRVRDSGLIKNALGHAQGAVYGWRTITNI